ncbi:MAG: hypothetical protein IPP72_12170 [Chitinophagaceae bacterium]|nr:hypothetical protein [Chitinophagaceae bacterium]
MRFVYLSSILILAIACKQQPDNHANKITGAKKFHHITFLLYENFDTSLLSSAVAEATTFYNCTATVLSSQDLPAFAYQGYRYKADSLLKFQTSLLPTSAESVVGITNKDISTSQGEHKDWGVFGLGYCPGKACVISVFRLKSGTYDQIKERFIKVVLHELGHNMGLPHCNANNEHCLMNDAKGTGATVDKEKKWLCPNCQQLLSN